MIDEQKVQGQKSFNYIKVFLALTLAYVLVLFSYHINHIAEKMWWLSLITASLNFSIIYCFLLKKDIAFSIFVFKYNDTSQSSFFRFLYFITSILLLILMPLILITIRSYNIISLCIIQFS